MNKDQQCAFAGVMLGGTFTVCPLEGSIPVLEQSCRHTGQSSRDETTGDFAPCPYDVVAVGRERTRIHSVHSLGSCLEAHLQFVHSKGPYLSSNRAADTPIKAVATKLQEISPDLSLPLQL